MHDCAPQRAVSIRWLGQAGYAVTGPEGQLCLIDAYLSDWAEEDIGLQRVVEPPVSVAELRPSVVICTHWHHDHLDRPTCRALAAANPEAMFVGPPSNTPRLLGSGVAPERIVELRAGERWEQPPFAVRATFARHEVPGWLTEDAIGVVLEIAGRRIYHSGDTEYDRRVLESVGPARLDLALLVSNGSGGNMNAVEAAVLAHQLAPAVASPNHFGMWRDEAYGPGATLDPEVFCDVCRRLGGPRTHVPNLGEAWFVEVS